ncbi:MAG: hypothetical protein ACXWDO_07610 [Bacteroidia bacterium]
MPFQRVSTDVGNIGLSMTNAGTIGDPRARTNPQGPPSMEYPLNSGIEHLFEGGLWIGAVFNGQTVVATGSVDASNGYVTGGSGFEFSGATPFTQRSSFTESDYYTPAAISQQDFIVTYTDSFTVVPGTSIPIQDHNLPLKAVIRQESYAWNFSFADYFVILNYKITNRSNTPWDSVYLGLWTDLVVRNINVTQETGSNFFNKGGGGVIDSLFALYAYQVSGDDADYTRSYGASQVLGIDYRNLYFHPNNAQNLQAAGYNAPKVNYNFWNFRDFSGGGAFAAPANDQERYIKMSRTMTDAQLNSLNTPSNRTQLISVGPIPRIEPGETVSFALAMVCAKQIPDGVGNSDTKFARQDLAENLNWSRRTYLGEDINENGQLDSKEDINGNNKIDRFILPEPPANPKVKIVTESGKAQIYWNKASVNSVDPISKQQDFEGFRIYKTNIGDDMDLSLTEDMKLIASFDSAGNNVGFNNGFKAIELPEPVTFEGDTTKYYYKYEVGNLLNGWQYMFAVTAFDKGNAQFNLQSLESSRTGNASHRVFAGTKPQVSDNQIGVYPNPYRGSAAWDGTSSRDRKLYFYNLPNRAKITIYTIAGDVIKTLDHNGGNYTGEDIQWFRTYGAGNNKVFSGGEHAWDLLSENNQLVSHGLYMFSVKDLDSEAIYTGTFSILR